MTHPSSSSTVDFTSVTETSGADVSSEQIVRLAQRYYWAGEYCRGQDVLEVACGAGQGLGYLSSLARSLRAGDITPALVNEARTQYGSRIEISEMDATALPFPAQSLNTIILFEALYYLPSAERFVDECIRVLRPKGKVLIATANKDLYDFNPSPFSSTYYGVAELGQLFEARGFFCDFFGNTPIETVSLRQRILSPIKKVVINLGLMPKTMAGKKLLKRLVFGKLVPMPAEIDQSTAPKTTPVPLKRGEPNRDFKVIYMAATLRK